MIPAVKAVRNAGLAAFTDAETFSLQQITNLVEAYTKIDRVEFVGYVCAPSNPIWGEFLRWNSFAPYRGNEEVVEVRYATHLSQPELRFVITKELCHALEHRSGTHTVSPDSVSSLITTLSLTSGISANSAPGIRAEKLAEVCAMEILIPLTVRQKLSEGGRLDQNAIARISERLELPARLVSDVFDPDYMQVAQTIFA